MKTYFYYLYLLLVSLFCLPSHAAGSDYQDALRTALACLDAAESDYLPCRNQFERMAQMYPDDPRPVCLLAFFKQHLPPFLRNDSEIAEGKEKAKDLFAKETPSADKPYWGVYFLNMIQQ
jgi:hypothetical protein